MLNNSFKPEFRLAEVSDAGKLAELSRQVFSSTYGAVLNPKTLTEHLEAQLSIEVFQKEILERHTIFWLATQDNTLLGFIKLEPTKAPACITSSASIELSKLYVSFEHQQLGIGNSLLEIALKNLHAELDTIWLLVWEHNTRAIAFYHKQGFEKSGMQDVIVGETVFHDFVMSRRIA